jgi:hypothetical protein
MLIAALPSRAEPDVVAASLITIVSYRILYVFDDGVKSGWELVNSKAY